MALKPWSNFARRPQIRQQPANRACLTAREAADRGGKRARLQGASRAGRGQRAGRVALSGTRCACEGCRILGNRGVYLGNKGRHRRPVRQSWVERNRAALLPTPVRRRSAGGSVRCLVLVRQAPIVLNLDALYKFKDRMFAERQAIDSNEDRFVVEYQIQIGDLFDLGEALRYGFRPADDKVRSKRELLEVESVLIDRLDRRTGNDFGDGSARPLNDYWQRRTGGGLRRLGGEPSNQRRLDGCRRDGNVDRRVVGQAHRQFAHEFNPGNRRGAQSKRRGAQCKSILQTLDAHRRSTLTPAKRISTAPSQRSLHGLFLRTDKKGPRPWEHSMVSPQVRRGGKERNGTDLILVWPVANCQSLPSPLIVSQVVSQARHTRPRALGSHPRVSHEGLNASRRQLFRGMVAPAQPLRFGKPQSNYCRGRASGPRGRPPRGLAIFFSFFARALECGFRISNRTAGAGTEKSRQPYSPVGREPEGVAGSLCPLRLRHFSPPKVRMATMRRIGAGRRENRHTERRPNQRTGTRCPQITINGSLRNESIQTLQPIVAAGNGDHPPQAVSRGVTS